MSWPVELDDAPPYALEPVFAPIPLEVVSLDLEGPTGAPFCLAVSDKSVFLLKSSGRNWKTLDVIQPAGTAVSGGFIETPTASRAAARDPIRFFVSSIHSDGRILTTFYVSRRGKKEVEGQTEGKIYRKDGPVLVSQRLNQDVGPVVVEMVRPGLLPKPLWNLPLPPGTGLFEFGRFSDPGEGKLARIEKDEDISLWVRDELSAKAGLRVGRPPLELPRRVERFAEKHYVPPLAADADKDGGEDLIVAINNPDVSGGFFLKAEDHRSRIAVLKVTRGAAGPSLEISGATPVVQGSVSALVVMDGQVIAAVVSAKTRETRLHRLKTKDTYRTSTAP